MIKVMDTKREVINSEWEIKAYEKYHSCPECKGALVLTEKNAIHQKFICSKCKTLYSLILKENIFLNKGKQNTKIASPAFGKSMSINSTSNRCS